MVVPHGIEPCIASGSAVALAGSASAKSRRRTIERSAVDGLKRLVASWNFSSRRVDLACVGPFMDLASFGFARRPESARLHSDRSIKANVEENVIRLREYLDSVPPIRLETGNLSIAPKKTVCRTILDGARFRLNETETIEGTEAILNGIADARYLETADSEGNMAGINLSQAEADALIAMEKRPTTKWKAVPLNPNKHVLKLAGSLGSEEFHIDVNRGRIDLKKCTQLLRTRKTVILLRLDIDGPPHRNPDGEIIQCPHMHIYREGIGDRWAVPISESDFRNIEDFKITLDDFLNYCNVVGAPVFPSRR